MTNVSSSDERQSTSLLNLPSELLDYILSFLSPVALATLASVCKKLKNEAEAERHWRHIMLDMDLRPNKGRRRDDSLLLGSFPSWKKLYAAHYPYWFIPEHRIWFADRASMGEPLGQLVISRYDHRTSLIEAYRLVAEHSTVTTVHWSYNPEVLIHTFEPYLNLFLDDPVIRLAPDCYSSGPRLSRETALRRGPGIGRLEAHNAAFESIRARIFPARALNSSYPLTGNMSIWPPLHTLPRELPRVRTASPSLFRDEGHRPKTYEQICQTAFRTRKFMVFGATGIRLGMRSAEDVATWSTLPKDLYTPTPEKPYQGIWVGDYAGHGCEFLVVMHITKAEIAAAEAAGRPIPPIRPSPFDAEWVSTAHNRAPRCPVETEDPPGHSGRLHAVKLTGDPNVPRGEYTWIAEDIGAKGLVRVADEQIFRGARIVKSYGHVAARGFVNDNYIESQLILVSHDRLAQYWEEFGHVSCYNRVNIEDYLDIENTL